MRVEISHLWVSQANGLQWCFLWVDDFPVLTCEVDA